MATSSDTEWVRTPRQARSQETFERFLDATRTLLDERPFEEITVADIVQCAGRTVGSFYARFEDKYAVLYELVQRLFQRIDAVTRAFCDPVRWEGATVQEFVHEAVLMNVSGYRRSGPVFRASFCAATLDPRFRELRVQVMASAAEHQKRLLVARADELGCDDPARASDQMFVMISATLDQELLFGRFTTTSPRSDVELVESLREQCTRILGLVPTEVD